jgi:hypothetical protein
MLMLATDGDSETSTDIQYYLRTCSEFILQISSKNWVAKYDLVQEENKARKARIECLKKTNEWITKLC